MDFARISPLLLTLYSCLTNPRSEDPGEKSRGVAYNQDTIQLFILHPFSPGVGEKASRSSVDGCLEGSELGEVLHTVAQDILR